MHPEHSGECACSRRPACRAGSGQAVDRATTASRAPASGLFRWQRRREASCSALRPGLPSVSRRRARSRSRLERRVWHRPVAAPPHRRSRASAPPGRMTRTTRSRILERWRGTPGPWPVEERAGVGRARTPGRCHLFKMKCQLCCWGVGHPVARFPLASVPGKRKLSPCFPPSAPTSATTPFARARNPSSAPCSKAAPPSPFSPPAAGNPSATSFPRCCSTASPSSFRRSSP